MEESSNLSPVPETTLETSQATAQKEQQWQHAIAEARHITDKLGHGVDEGVLETIVALNMLGLNTVQSCEGHLDHGTGAPYIDFAGKDTSDLEDQFYEILGKEDMQEEVNKLSEEITQHNLRERAKLMDYLRLFYQNRLVPYDKHLVIESYALSKSRLQSQGSDLQGIVPPELKQQRLKEYQEEMRAFTKFLKNTYFGTTLHPRVPAPQSPPSEKSVQAAI